MALYADFVPPAKEIKAEYAAGAAMPVTLHDGSQIVLRKADGAYDPSDQAAAFSYLTRATAAGEIATGLLYVQTGRPDMHELANTPDVPLATMAWERVCPGSATLARIQDRLR